MCGKVEQTLWGRVPHLGVNNDPLVPDPLAPDRSHYFGWRRTTSAFCAPLLIFVCLHHADLPFPGCSGVDCLAAPRSDGMHVCVRSCVGCFCQLFSEVLLKALWGGRHRRPSIFESARQFQGGDIKHAIHSLQVPQEDMDSMDTVYSMDPKTSWRPACDISCRQW